jgi:hypothetical protein
MLSQIRSIALWRVLIYHVISSEALLFPKGYMPSQAQESSASLTTHRAISFYSPPEKLDIEAYKSI